MMDEPNWMTDAETFPTLAEALDYAEQSLAEAKGEALVRELMVR